MALPTSRKKYYLQATIKPQWIDEDFLPEFCKHIESSSSKSLRDIFISNSSRMGTFSVKTKQIAEKLLASFSTNNISCRGRKPQAEIIPVTPTNFQIKLRNLNNCITSTEFISWILSLHYDSFDIKLHPVRIYKGSNKCILSFNTIDTAIHVKNKLTNILFRDTKLYFTHWHVPRRNINNIQKPSKIGVVLGLVDNTSINSINSGYSTAITSGSKSNTTSPIVNGALYLRDSSIPPPPIRSPPHPPINQYPISIEEEILSNEANKMYLNQLENQLEKQKIIISQLLHDKQNIICELDNQKQINKHINDKYSILYNKYTSLLNINTVLLWE
eukprot:943101_1